MIIAAAIRKDGIWYAEQRHDLIFVRFGRVVNLKNAEQGFITDQFEFVDRSEAAQIALTCNQIKEPAKTLFSEDLIDQDPNYWKERR